MFKVLDHFVRFERIVNIKEHSFQELLTAHSHDPTIQLIEADSIAGKKHILHAIYISLLAFKRKVNFAKKLQLEVLLTLAQVRQIKKAIDLMSPKNNDVIVLAVGTDEKKVFEVFNDVVKKLDGQKKEIIPNNKKLERLFGFRSHKIYSHEELICEKMALIETLR